MALFINTNVASLIAQNNVANSQTALTTSIQRLSSGLRINSAKDDAAGYAIAARMTSQIGGMNQAAQNSNDGISMAQTAAGALTQVTSDLQTMRNLSVQAANGTNSASDRASLQASISQLQQDIGQIASNTQYNGLNLLDGSLSNVQFQVGANAGQTINTSIATSAPSAIGDNAASSSTGAGAASMDGASALAGGLAAAVTAGNQFTSQVLSIAVGGQTLTTGTFASGSTAYNIAQQINNQANASGASITAVANTYAQLSGFAAGSVSLILQGAPNASGNANPVTVSASLSTATDVGGLAAAINAVTAQTGISAVANTVTGTISLNQSQGYDIAVANTASSTGSVSLSGSNSTGTAIGTARVLTATAATANASVVGGEVDFHSSSSYTVAPTTANTSFLANAAAGTSTLNSVSAIDVTKITNGLPSGANNAIYVVDGAINTINGLQAQLGALQNRFTNAQSSLTTTSTNMQQARSRIQDTDFAAETANLTHNQILQQAGVAMLAQANAMPNSVLTLLK